MIRRAFITLLGGGAAAWPMAARAQRPALPVVALVEGGSLGGSISQHAAFRRGLADSGVTETRT